MLLAVPPERRELVQQNKKDTTPMKNALKLMVCNLSLYSQLACPLFSFGSGMYSQSLQSKEPEVL